MKKTLCIAVTSLSALISACAQSSLEKLETEKNHLLSETKAIRLERVSADSFTVAFPEGLSVSEKDRIMDRILNALSEFGITNLEETSSLPNTQGDFWGLKKSLVEVK